MNIYMYIYIYVYFYLNNQKSKQPWSPTTRSFSAMSWFVKSCVECPIVLFSGFKGNPYENETWLGSLIEPDLVHRKTVAICQFKRRVP